MKNISAIVFSLVIGFYFISIPSSSNAQSVVPSHSSKHSYWYVNLNGGSSLFFGDIKENKFWPTTVNGISEWRLGGGLQLGRQFSPVFGLRGQGLYGQLSGVRSSANEYFQADYIEFNLAATISLNNLFSGYRPERKWDIYLLAGLGLTNYNSTSYRLSDNSVIARRGYGFGKGIGGRTLEGIAVGGLGINYKLSNKLSLQLETANRVLNSDAMDTWINKKKYDIYNYTSIGLSYRFGQKSKKSFVSQKSVPPVPLLKAEKKPQNSNMLSKPVPPPPTTAPTVAPKVEKQKPAQQEVITKQVKQPEPVRTILPVKPMLEYRVQIRAKYGKPLSKEWLSKKYNLPASQIRMNIHEGYYIYTVGSYKTYYQARRERDILRSKNGIYDAFVVAFRNGKRLDKLPSNP